MNRGTHEKFCSACGSTILKEAEICPKCGVRQIHHNTPSNDKSKIVAGILALLFGGFGFHKFYMGKIAVGIIYLIFFWTFIPALISFFEGIIYLVESDESFANRIK